jgi:putative oxidoreductase
MSTTSKSCCSAQSAAFSASLGIFLIRLALAAVFIYYGGQHLFGFFHGRGLHQFTEQIKTDGFPILPPVLWAGLSGIAEFFGGILLLIGLASRLAAIPIIIDMLAAMWVYRNGGFGSIDFNMALIAMAALVLLAGPGMISLDAVLFRGGARGPQPIAPTT